MNGQVPSTPEEAARRGWQIVDCPVDELHVAAQEPDGDGVFCWTEKRWVGSPLDTLRALAKDDPLAPEKAAAVLRELEVNLRGKDKLARMAGREAAVAALKGKVSSPAGLVDAAIGGSGSESKSKTNARGQPVALEDPDPWPESVDGAELLEALEMAFTRFLVLPKGAETALPLWVLFAHAFDAFHVAPLLALVSPVKRCGKTTCVRLLARMVPRGLAASSISPAATFRSIEKYRPTLIGDEADSLFRDNDELRRIFNASHTRDTASVIRTAGEDHEPTIFSTWCPKCLALIGRLPDTLEDRSVQITMRRKAPGENAERLRIDRLSFLSDLRRKCARWALDHSEALATADPPVPHELNDRAADNWRPLLSIADTVGGDWPEKARAAAKLLSGSGTEEESVRVKLLADLRSTFIQHGKRVFTDALLDHLHGLEERPWPEYGHKGKPISAPQLARLLKPFGIKPRQVKVHSVGKKGYRREDCEDAFRRYLPPLRDETPKPLNSDRAFSGIQGETSGAVVSVQDPKKANSGREGFGVSSQEEKWAEL